MAAEKHILAVLVEDHPGVLNRVVSLMRRRSFNIDSITVGYSEQPGVSRITIVLRGEPYEVEQVSKQLYKLMEVLKVTDLPERESVVHELMMVKVATKGASRAEIMQIVDIYQAKIVDATPTTLMIQAAGGEEKINALLAMLRPFGIRELVRTGPVAMTRGASGTQIKSHAIAAD
ncbi:MAG: acetolactate synthase small subunit [Thermomicrobiales bacterium]|nr:acetolactate synthase small subunit [Thermomicrobiales bacterium]